MVDRRTFSLISFMWVGSLAGSNEIFALMICLEEIKDRGGVVVEESESTSLPRITSNRSFRLPDLPK